MTSNTNNLNTGHYNTGEFNTGHGNIGSFNTGNFNTGDHNSGHCNTGNYNTGDYNSGNYNSGNFNIGLFNSCNYANGLFNSKSPKISMFNKPTEMTFEEFMEKYSEAYQLLCYSDFNLTHWIRAVDMTDEEKEAHPEYAITGGYLRKKDYKEACCEMWESFNEDERNLIKNLPNFDKDVFFEITGIEV